MNGKFNPKVDRIRVIFSKIRALLDFQKRALEVFLLVVRLRKKSMRYVAEKTVLELPVVKILEKYQIMSYLFSKAELC